MENFLRPLALQEWASSTVWIPTCFSLDDTPFFFPSPVYHEKLPAENRGFQFDGQQTVEIESALREAADLLGRLQRTSTDLDHLDNAFGYASGAFLSRGLDQLVNAIIALEALLREGGGVTEKMAKRVASILGETEQERKDIPSQFNEL